jgi:hypothetical protein
MDAAARNEADRLIEEGRALLSRQPAAAIFHLERALERDPGHPRAVEALRCLAEGYQSLKRYRECGYLLESCVRIEPSDLTHHLRLCAFRLTRAHYRKAAEGVAGFLAAGGSPGYLEGRLTEERHPKSVVRALRALCDVLLLVELADLPPFRNMGEILAYEERIKTAGRPELAASVAGLPGVSPDAAARLGAAGLSTIAQLAAASVPELVGLGFREREAEALVDVASSEVYLAKTQSSRPAEPG